MTDAPAAPATPEAAQFKLGELIADPAWGKALLQNDAAAVAEFHSLSKLAASEPELVAGSAEALAAETAKANDSANLATFIKGTQFPVEPKVIEQIAKGMPVSAADRDLGLNWLENLKHDQEKAGLLLKGNPEVRRQLLNAAILANSEIAP